MKDKDTEFVTPTNISASGEAQESEISPTTLEAAKTLSQVASKTVSTYKRRTRSTDKGKDMSTGLEAETEVNTGFDDINTSSIGVSTGSGPVSTPSVVKTVNVVIPSPIKSQREGKAPMTTEDTPTRRTKAQILQEKAGLAEALRVQAQLDEEAAKQVYFDALLAERMAEEEELSEQQKKRKVQLTKDVLGKDLPEEDFAKRMVDMKLSQLKNLSFKEIKEEFDKLVEQVDTFVPMNFEATKAKLKRYGEELQTRTSKKQKVDDKVKEEEPGKRTGKRKK
ncbi:hypothetical protein Tco_0893793 [Tanacetum coccineum]|uniref:Uncharacterized protein n=1 Tax=Tanacetum coccineum TaxID=301880 RepID=A0ABQ5C9V6_9ASTR